MCVCVWEGIGSWSAVHVGLALLGNRNLTKKERESTVIRAAAMDVAEQHSCMQKVRSLFSCINPRHLWPLRNSEASLTLVPPPPVLSLSRFYLGGGADGQIPSLPPPFAVSNAVRCLVPAKTCWEFSILSFE